MISPTTERPTSLIRLVLLVLLAVAAVAGAPFLSAGAVAGSVSQNGWTSSASASPSAITRGSTVTITVRVTSTTTRRAHVDLEIHSSGSRSLQRIWSDQAFRAGTTRWFTTSWTVPMGEPTGSHVAKVGLFSTTWNLQSWNDAASSFEVASSGSAPSTTAASTSTIAPPTTTAPATTTTTPTPTTTPTTTTVGATSTTVASSTGRFATLPPGSALPSEATCAARVRRTPENRSINAVPNATRGAAANATYPRVTGNFVGTTDEILQWAACKWGIDEDIVRAQIARESWWRQDTGGDLTTTQSSCLPRVRSASGTCPESLGLGQVRYLYHSSAFANEDAYLSSAYNVDYTYAVWRTCYEGGMSWLNTVERGAEYTAGDLWGCVGTWFAGRWRTAPALTYISSVQDYLGQRVWEAPSFQGG